MTYKKPDDVSYIDMCIYIDNHVYEEDCDLNLVYQYLYLLAYMLASSTQMLKYKYLDSFALFAANKMYFRLTNKKQFEVNENGEHKLSRVKSIMNYLKSSIYFLKVDFEQSEYYQEINLSGQETSLSYNFDNVVSTSLSGIDLIEFEMTMGDVSQTCIRFLETIPYDKNSTMWLNIYVSTMLTFLNMVTLNRKSKKRVDELTNTRGIRQYHYEGFYDDEEQAKPILFHLPDNMSDYIIVLARQLKHIVGRDLSDILHTKVGNDVILLKSMSEEYASDTYGESYED